MSPDGFFSLVERLFAELTGGEVLLCNLDGEDSDFARLNRNRIRQAGGLRRHGLGLTLIAGRRQVESGCDLSGDPEADRGIARELIARMRERIAHVPEDPYLDYSTTPSESDHRVGEGLPPAAEAVADLIAAAEGLDLVGIWASGEIHRGFASSLGHRHWHSSSSFNLDWSCYLRQDKALKDGYGGFVWEPERLRGKLEALRRGLEIMSHPARTLQPGRVRAYLAPAAVEELMELLAWGGFGLKDHRTSQTPLLRLVRGERCLAPSIAIVEEHARGLAPGFTPEGFAKPAAVTLIECGAYRDCLVDSRSGKEYGSAVNAASECPESLALGPGDIPAADALDRLGTGLYVGNLWYLNYADRNDCRITGMTRFGTFWVEKGEPVAPVEVMRFDDSLYHLLGDRLEGLTKERELILSASSYGGRSTASSLLPGILIGGIDLAL